MHKHLLSLTFLFLVFTQPQLLGQQRTFSPGSRFGAGELNRVGFGQTNGMGKTGIGISSPNYLNNLNPAAYAAMDSLSFYFEAGLNGFSQKISDAQTSSDFSNIAFEYFALGFPISGRVFTSISLLPYSNTGYNIESQTADPNGVYGSATTRAIGNGNISKLNWGFGIAPFKNMSLGANFSYLFGSTKNANYISFVTDPSALSYGRISELQVNDIYFDFGLQYKIELADNKNINIGAVMAPAQAIRNKFTSLTAQGVTVTQGNNLTLQGDTIEDVPLESNTFDIPLSIGIGVSYNIEEKLTLAADYKFEGWSKSTFPDTYTQTTDMQRVSAGCQFIPNERSARNYLQRIRYRLGGYYQNDYILFLGNKADEFGMSFGLGLPLKRSRSSVNISCDFGQKGDHSLNGFKENYIRFMLGFAIHEYWFVKQKFD